MPRFPIVLAAVALAAFWQAPAHAQDASAGQSVFRSQCAICHSPKSGNNMTGPSLFGVVGRASATAAGFKYSAAMESAHLTWNAATLDKYLENPRGVVPGTLMAFAGVKDSQKRADLIAYLATLK